MDSLATYMDLMYKTAVVFGFTVFFLKLPVWIKAFRWGRKKDLFECQQCGNCCRIFKIIELDKKDIERFQEAGYTDFADETGKSMKRVNGKCVLLKDDKCSAHEARARVCREFPFQKVYGMWFFKDLSFCPGIDEFKKKL